MAFEDVAIVGYGETAYHKKKQNQKHPLEYIKEAIDLALDDSGLTKDDIDGLSVTSHELHTENEVTIAESFGIDGRWFLGGNTGNAAPIIGMIRGARAIANGTVDTVVVAAGDASTPDSNMEMIDAFNGSIYDYMRPYGFGGANGIFALLQQRHMHEYGTTREQLGKIAVTQREHAKMNPNAIFREPLTMDDYLSARPIVEPLHLFDCVHPCGGGGAIVLTSQERAADLDEDPVYILSADEFHNPNPTSPFSLETGFEQLNLFDDRVNRSDVDAVQLYDNYPIFVAMQLEALGFCEKGNSGEYIEDTDFSINGDLPLNTGGGQLSVGQANGAGGILHTIEAIRQLRGEGGDRQVENSDTILATGPGTVAYGGVLCYSGIVLGNENAQGVQA